MCGRCVLLQRESLVCHRRYEQIRITYGCVTQPYCCHYFSATLRPMGRKRFGNINCGIGQALEVVGDWWSLMIVRDAVFGACRFGDFEKSLGIAKNILTNRLDHLVEHGIFEKVDVGSAGTHFEYHLTDKGDALLPVLIALREWADEWVFGRGHEPILILDRRTGKRVPKIRVRASDGRPLSRRDLQPVPGPGASKDTIGRFQSSRQ
jgi:DNA-binding HxlR family transcriptional regulator